MAVAIETLAGPAMRTFFAIAQAWQLTEREQMQILALKSRATLADWRRGRTQRVGRDTIERVSYILGIFKAINILVPDQRSADLWVRAPNSALLFGGRSALDKMTSGNVRDLYVVRQYLNAELV